MSNFHKTTSTGIVDGKKENEPGEIKPEEITSKQVKDISPAIIEQENRAQPDPQPQRETNASALRKSSNFSGRASQKSNIGGSTASRAGKNIVGSTPKSKHSSVLSSNRAIRTGAFQRIKA